MEIFHVLNRGVDKRKIVIDIKDRLRFMQGLYLYNDANLLDRNIRRFSKERTTSNNRKHLVYLHAFCLMKNHYHLLLSPVDDEIDNLSAFMRKLNMGYAKYFNEKYKRSGALWQGKYKRIHIVKDAHFQYIPYYIHLNPLDYTYPKWRTGKVENVDAALEKLSNYKWSSYPDYCGNDNYPSLIEKSVLSDILGNMQNQQRTITSIITNTEKALHSEILE